MILIDKSANWQSCNCGSEMYCNEGFENLICSEKIFSKYLYWFLKGNTMFLKSLVEVQHLKKYQRQ